MGKLPNYVQYFGANMVEGVAESWVEAEMGWVELGEGWNELRGGGWSWVEVGARFSNTHFKTMVAQSLESTFLGETLFDVTTHPPPQSNFLKKDKKSLFFRLSPLVKNGAGDEVGNNW